MDQREIFTPAEFADNPPEFEMFWKKYPKRGGRRVGKAAALRLWMKLKPEEQCEAFAAMERYAEGETAKNGFARDAERFLKAGYWKDWSEEVEVDPEVERGELVAKLVKARWSTTQVVATEEGLCGGAGTEKWAEIPTSRLRKMAAVVVADESF